MDETLIYVPIFGQNLIFVFYLEKFDYSCLFGNEKFSLLWDLGVIGTGSLVNNFILACLSSLKDKWKISLLALYLYNKAFKTYKSRGSRTSIDTSLSILSFELCPKHLCHNHLCHNTEKFSLINGNRCQQ